MVNSPISLGPKLPTVQERFTDTLTGMSIWVYLRLAPKLTVSELLAMMEEMYYAHLQNIVQTLTVEFSSICRLTY